MTSSTSEPAAAWSRRRFLAVTGGALAGVNSLAAAPAAAPLLPSFDEEIERFMAARQVPGGALAVVKDRRLVYARGYGLADRERGLPVRADALFRIASLSKPVTAVGVLKLVEQGKLTLDEPALARLDLKPHLEAGAAPDARLANITIRQLLQHTGGWDRDLSFDPMFRPGTIAQALGVEPPAQPAHVIRYMLGRKLDFAPGTRYAYSNFGYCVLGRIIEAVTGQTYEAFMQRELLAPLGIHRMQLGQTLAIRQAKGEVKYYLRDDARADAVFPALKEKVPWAYGGFYLEAMDAHGGWIASAVDLARFAAAFDDPARCPVLSPGGVRQLFAPPPAPAWRDHEGKLNDHYYGLGWMVRPVGREGRNNTWHSGSLPGTSTLMVRRWDGLDWVVLFNQRSRDPKLPDGEIDAALHRAAAKVKAWPEQDLFAAFA